MNIGLYLESLIFLHVWQPFEADQTRGCLVKLHGISVLMNEPSAPLCQDLQARSGWIRVWSSLVCRWLGELNQESYESVAPSERKTKRHARGKRWGWVEPFEVGGWLEDFYEVNDSPYLKVKYIYVQVPKIYFQVKWAVQLWSVA